MARTKIDYGIDLGTTNSSISRMENGVPIIKKSTTGSTQTDTTSSCVSYNKKQKNFVGNKAYRILASERLSAFRKNDPKLINTFEEFKRTIGTDKEYECNNMGKSFSSEELSSEVLKTLKGYVRDEDISSIVITVPAKFQGYQDDSTMKASQLAGFQHCILLQEPIAASMAYGIDSKNFEGEWLVFDFGGGTFDVALMRSNEGILKVVDTEGDMRLGGKNIDYAIIDEIIIPYLDENYTINNILSDEERKNSIRNAVKRFAEETKINLSPKDKNHYDILTDEPIGEDDSGNEIEIDLTVTKEQYEEVVKPIFNRAIDLSIKLLKNNNLTGSDLTTVLMIGGPTFSETLRDMIRDKITSKVDVSIDPMIAVAKGAALFASTQNIPDTIKEIDKSKIQLKLIYPTDVVETEVKFGIKVLRDKTDGEIPESLFIELNRQDKGWSSGTVEIKGDAEILDIVLEPGQSNGFLITITDEKGTVYPSDPESFSIIQGFKVAGATLPFDLLIDVFDKTANKQHLVELKGLRKNQPLPAKGKGTFQTQKDIRPGNSSDQVRIPVYYGQINTRAVLNDPRGEVVITGDQLPGLLPKGSDVELTVEVDASRMITVSADFPYLDDYIIDNVIKTGKRKTVSIEYLERELEKPHSALNLLEEEYSDLDIEKIDDIRNSLNELEVQLENGGSDADTRDEVFNRMRELLIEIDELESIGEWPKAVQELKEALELLEKRDEQFGDEKTASLIQGLNDQAKNVIEKKDLKMCKDLTLQISQISFAIVDAGAGVALEISAIKDMDDSFDMHDWSNRSQARQLMNDAKSIIAANNASKANLRPIIIDLYNLLPKLDDSIEPIDDDVLEK